MELPNNPKPDSGKKWALELTGTKPVKTAMLKTSIYPHAQIVIHLIRKEATGITAYAWHATAVHTYL